MVPVFLEDLAGRQHAIAVAQQGSAKEPLGCLAVLHGVVDQETVVDHGVGPRRG